MISLYPESKRRKAWHRVANRYPRMTFVIGFKCADGVVLCADSFESDGLTKRTVDKIKQFGTTDWGIAIGGAGPSGIIDKFSDEISDTIGRAKYDRKQFELVIEKTLQRYKASYHEDDDIFRVLVATYCISRIERNLYRSDGSHLSPIKDHAHIGTGHSLWRFFVETLYERGSSVADNVRLGLFITREATNYVDGVDGPIRIVSHASGDDGWKHSGIWRLSAIDFDFNAGDPHTALREAWKRSVPPSLPEQIEKFKGVKIPGDELTFLRGVKMEGLSSASGRNRAANSFWSNRDKLRKRALLEKERDRAQENNNQQP